MNSAMQQVTKMTAGRTVRLPTMTGVPGAGFCASGVPAAGGVLGKVIAVSDMVRYITAHADVFGSMGIFFPFLLAAVLKTAQGYVDCVIKQKLERGIHVDKLVKKRRKNPQQKYLTEIFAVDIVNKIYLDRKSTV